MNDSNLKMVSHRNRFIHQSTPLYIRADMNTHTNIIILSDRVFNMNNKIKKATNPKQKLISKMNKKFVLPPKN